MENSYERKVGVGQGDWIWPRTQKKADILQTALGLFFPNGKSKKGHLEEFSFDILDYQEEAVLDDEVTVGEFYSLLKLGMLRFYLCTKSKHTVSREHVPDETNCENLEEPQPTQQQEMESATTNPDLNMSSSSIDTEVIIGAHVGPPNLFQLDDTVPILGSDEEDVLTIAPGNVQHNISHDNASTSTPNTHVHIQIHRSNILEEMISHFIDPDLLSCSLSFGHIDERGADAAGVSRDVYAAFWAEFYSVATEGLDMKVPMLSARRREEEWKSVGRILVKGFLDHGYYPCQLAQAFTLALILGEKYVTSDLLFDSFLCYLSNEEMDLVRKALQEDLDDEEEADLIDFLDCMGSTTIPTKDNLKSTLLSIGHKLIIQQPKYVLVKMSLSHRILVIHQASCMKR